MTDPLIPPQLKGQPKLVVRALLQFVLTALTLTDEGYVTVLTKCLSSRTTEGEAEDLVIGFEVVGHGRGVSPEQVQTVLDNAKGSDHRASEPALTMVCRMVQKCGGTVSIRSNLNVGTRFCFDLGFQRVQSYRPTLALRMHAASGACHT